MIRTTHTVTIARPPAQVFDYLADSDNLLKYEPYVEQVQRTSTGPIGIGSTWTHTRRQGRQRITAPIEITECQPPRRLAIVSGAGAFLVRSAIDFVPEGAGTRLTEVLEMEIKGPMRLLSPLISRSARKQVPEIHQRLKEVLEQGSR
jgi:carbon monoxide dehydrogenase subunit G